jgi:thiosulfate reductase/polysulfide reductase chain A
MMFFKTGVSRRGFVKLGLSGLAGMITRKNSSAKTGGISRSRSAVSRSSLKSLNAVPTTCRQCPAGCGIIAYLDGNRLVQVLGNPDHPENRGGICAKGIAAINLVNDVERVLTPLKRTGPRGGSRWSRITWDEAYAILQTRLGNALSEGRSHEVIVDTGVSVSLLDHFLSALGFQKVFRRQIEKNRCQSAAWKSMVGQSQLDADVDNCRTIFNFGATPYESHDRFVGMAQRLVAARVDKGARLVTFDVRMSETAAKSDVWLPVRAGTDGLLALALCRVIMEKGWQDQSVFKSVSPAFIMKLKKYLLPYTTGFAESECGIPAEQIERLACQFATRTPSVAIMGGGALDHANGFENARCITLLNIIAGNIGRPGGLLARGYPEGFLPDSEGFDKVVLEKNGIFDLRSMLEDASGVDTVFVFQANPAFDDPESGKISRILKDEKQVPFLAVMDTHMSETAMLADLVLPAATSLESWDLDIRMSFNQKPLVGLIQPAVSLLSDAEVLRSPVFNMGKLLEQQYKPRGEAKEIGQVCLDLAHRLGGEISRKFPFEDTLDFLKNRITVFPDIVEKGGLRFLKKQGFWESQFDIKGREVINGSSILSSFGERRNSLPFPAYRPLDTAHKKKPNTFVITTFKNGLYAYGATNSKWAREFFHDNRLWMNSQSARKLGLKNGAKVRVISSAGVLNVRLLVTERIHPDSVAIAEGLGHSAFGNVARARRFASKDPDTRLVWWEKQGNGVNPKIILQRNAGLDPFSFGLKDTVVRIEKG